MKKATKRISPYTTLQQDCRAWAKTVLCPNMVDMWVYEEKDLGCTFRMKDLAERTRAADQLGYDVVLIYVKSEGLLVQYRKRPDAVPWSIHP